MAVPQLRSGSLVGDDLHAQTKRPVAHRFTEVADRTQAGSCPGVLLWAGFGQLNEIIDGFGRYSIVDGSR